MTNQEIVVALAGKGLDMAEDNPNLRTVATTLGVLVAPLHEASIVHNEGGKNGQGQVTAPTDKSKSYLAITGGARGRDAWLPIPKGAKAHVASMAQALTDLAETLPDDK